MIYRIEPADPAQLEIIQAWLTTLPFEAFEETESHLDAWLPDEKQDRSELETQLDDLAEQFRFSWTANHVKGKNWNEAWESNYDPVFVSKRTLIKAPFHTDIEGEADYDKVLIIEPRMSFGTGHHETTRLMLRLMESMEWSGKSVVDAGCGTGVLGIYTSVMGAADVLGIDNHPAAAENALENACRNGVSNFEIIEGGVELLKGKSADAVLANINRQVILSNLDTLIELVKPHGSLLISGLLKEDGTLFEAEIEPWVQNGSLTKTEFLNEERWIAYRYSKHQ